MNKEKKEKYEELHAKYSNIEWAPQYMPLLRIASKIIKPFPVKKSFSSNLPNDGALFFWENHLNFYDSLVFDAALKKFEHFVLAGDEPRGTIQGLSFAAKGVIWVTRDDKASKRQAGNALIDLLSAGINIVECPEGKWCLSENKLLLNMSKGAAKSAIEASKYAKIYIVPVVINYNYFGNTAIVKNANVDICDPILVSSNMDYNELHEKITEIMWTARWSQLESNAKKNKSSMRIEGDGSKYVFSREKESIDNWEKKIERLKKQYKIDWKKEELYELKTKEQLLQETMEKYINPNPRGSKYKLLKK